MDVSKEFTYDIKNELRKKLASLRAAVDNRLERERAVAEKLFPMLKGSCMIYVSIGSELSTHEIIKKLSIRSEVYAPYTINGNIVPRKLVSLGSADSRGNCSSDCYENDGNENVKIDVCVTPLLGFNGNGYRLGYGKGCYDKFFENHNTYKIGVAFDVQRVDFIPQAHDVPLDCCITESGVIYFDHACDIR